MKRFAIASLSYALLVWSIHLAFAQVVPLHWISKASSNQTLVFAARAILDSIIVNNPTGTAAYLHLYNKATAPNCGTDVPVLTIAIPQSNGPSVGALQMLFGNGIGFCLTGGSSDTDSSNAVANVVINLGITGLANPTTNLNP